MLGLSTIKFPHEGERERIIEQKIGERGPVRIGYGSYSNVMAIIRAYDFQSQKSVAGEVSLWVRVLAAQE